MDAKIKTRVIFEISTTCFCHFAFRISIIHFQRFIMVLVELGGRIQNALRSMASATLIDDEIVNTMIREIQRALLEADVNVKIVKQLSQDIRNKVNLDEMASGVNRRNVVKKTVFDALCSMMDAGRKPFEPVRGKSNVIVLVGLQGNGKTTSCTKLAYFYQRKRFKTCLVCADTFRAGAYDQLRQNATKANIPYFGSYTERDPVRIAMEGVESFKDDGFEVIIVDTSGRHKEEDALFEEMEQIVDSIKPDNIIFTMDGKIGQAAYDQALAFQNSVDVGSVIVTKLDGHAKGGGALSAVAATNSPVQFIGTGEHITEFEQFEARSFVSRLLGMGDMQSLMKAFSESDIGDQKEVVETIMQGNFCLRIMRDQFQTILSLGPLSQVMSMIPGLSQMMPQGKDQESGDRIKRCMTVMDSMTDKELNDPELKIFSDSRIRRVAQGAGVPISAVHELFQMYKPFRKMLDKMKGLNSMGRGGGMPNMRQLQSMMNPQLLQQMGGPAAIQNMMKSFGGQGGMPGFPGL